MGEMPSNYTPKIKWMTIKAEVIGSKKERLLPRQLITLVAQAKVYYSQSSFQTPKKKESHSRVKAIKQTTNAKTTKEEHEIN